jgi:hypothetical protein
MICSICCQVSVLLTVNLLHDLLVLTYFTVWTTFFSCLSVQCHYGFTVCTTVITFCVNNYGVIGLRNQLILDGVMMHYESIPQIWWNDLIPRTNY